MNHDRVRYDSGIDVLYVLLVGLTVAVGAIAILTMCRMLLGA